MSSGPQSIATMIALYHFKAESEPEISMNQDEFIEMLDMDPALNGWAFARRKRDGKEGYVPISYLGTNSNKHNNDHHQSNNLSQQQSNQMNNRSHKHSKTGNQSRSASPNPNKSRDDKNNYNQHGNTPYSNRNKFGDKGSNRNNFNNQNQQNYGHGNSQNTDPNQGGSKGKYSSQINNENDTGNNKGDNNNNKSNNSSSNSSANNNNPNNGSSSNNNNNGADARQIICSFHRDFIPDMNDLYKYFGEFGKVTNKIEIEYDSKKVPLAKIKFQTASCVDKVCDKGNRQQIPSGQQNGTIHIRVYRSMQDYINNGQRSNRGPYKHKSSRRGGF